MPDIAPILPPLRAVLFDLDGTLVDSNPLQVDAWLAAIEANGLQVSRDRIEVEIGKGGDQLVRDVFGQGIEDEKGDQLRDAQSKESQKLIERDGVRAFPGAVNLLQHLRGRGLQIALTTSSSETVQLALLKSAGIPASLFHVRVTASEAKASKPQADLYHATLAKLRLGPGECVNVGDTPYDCEAARRAGILTIGISGGFNSAEGLRRSGVRLAIKDVAELDRRWGEVLVAVTPHAARLSDARLAIWMDRALDVARQGLDAGEVPIAAIVIRGDGVVIGEAHNRMRATADKIAHAEIEALHAAAGRVDPQAKDCVLVSTLEPCVMCMGAAMEAGIDTVVFGLPAPMDGGTSRVDPPLSPESQMPRIIGGVRADESRSLLRTWLQRNAALPQAAYVRQLLSVT